MCEPIKEKIKPNNQNNSSTFSSTNHNVQPSRIKQSLNNMMNQMNIQNQQTKVNAGFSATQTKKFEPQPQQTKNISSNTAPKKNGIIMYLTLN